ncbi:hypothetical protein PVAP13_1NG223838 [Panicum virgatum]|uniref:Uncharacterized protein n=1 Tax=Panicum virgatum TaxID=38727 RepID=A0A8T0WZT1_PANVG|nr:hypothetical protein PVAP13_1NG223838 [Panicum virgatum]
MTSRYTLHALRTLKVPCNGPGFPRPVGSHATAVFIGASVLTKDWSLRTPSLRHRRSLCHCSIAMWWSRSRWVQAVAAGVVFTGVCDCVYLVALMPLAANLSISAGSEATVQPAAHVSAPFFAQKFQQQAQEQALLGCISCYQQMLRRKLNILLHRKILMMHSGGANDAIFFHFCASTAPS